MPPYVLLHPQHFRGVERTSQRKGVGGACRIHGLSSTHVSESLSGRGGRGLALPLHHLFENNALRLGRQTGFLDLLKFLGRPLQLALTQQGQRALDFAVLVPLGAGILEDLHAHVLVVVPLAVALEPVVAELAEDVGLWDGWLVQRGRPGDLFDIVARGVIFKGLVLRGCRLRPRDFDVLAGNVPSVSWYG